MSQSADHSHPALSERRTRSSAPSTSPKSPPTKLNGPSAPPKSTQPPATPLYWCDPVTVTVVQIEENLRCLLCEWPKDDRVPFPRDVLEMLEDLKKKVRTRDEKRKKTSKEETMRERCTDAHPMEDDPTNRMPMPFNWAKDVDESTGVSPVVSMDMRPTKHVNTVMIPPPAIYGPRDLSALCTGTRNLWGTLSCCHHCHHHPQPPRDPSAPSSATQNPWSCVHHRRLCLHPAQKTPPPVTSPQPHSCPPPPHFMPLSQPMPVYVIEMIRHPQGIAPMKPIIHTTSPVCHNVPPTPVQLVEASHHP